MDEHNYKLKTNIRISKLNLQKIERLMEKKYCKLIKGKTSNKIKGTKEKLKNKNKKLKFEIFGLFLLVVILLFVLTITILNRREPIEIIIKERNEKTITLSILDTETKIRKYNWNNEGFTNSKTHIVTEAGVYTLKVKYWNFLESKVVKIKIEESDFLNEGGTIISPPNKNELEEPEIPLEKEEINNDFVKTLTLSIVGNGAKITQTKITCEAKKDSCKVTLPEITRSGWTILGFNEDKNAKNAKYIENQQITLTNDKTVYAITKKTIVVMFNKNGADSIDYTSKSCTVYNTENSCKIKIPMVNKKGTAIKGFNETKSGYEPKYGIGSTHSFSENTVLYAGVASLNLNVIESKRYGNVIFERDSTCSYVNDDNNYLGYLSTWYKNFNKFFNGYAKIVLLGEDNYVDIIGKGTNGITYSFGYPFVQIYLRCDRGFSTFAHEFGHFVQNTYNTGIITSKVFEEIYNKYSSNKEYYINSNFGLREYSFRHKSEFWSDVFMIYWANYIGYTSSKFEEKPPCELMNLVSELLDLPMMNSRSCVN